MAVPPPAPQALQPSSEISKEISQFESFKSSAWVTSRGLQPVRTELCVGWRVDSCTSSSAALALKTTFRHFAGPSSFAWMISRPDLYVPGAASTMWRSAVVAASVSQLWKPCRQARTGCESVTTQEGVVVEAQERLRGG